MEFNIIATTARSLTLELDNKDAYFCSVSYSLYLNKEEVELEHSNNVVSLFDLHPDTQYTIELVEMTSKKSCSKVIRTLLESVRLDVRKFGAKGDGIKLDSTAIQAAILSCPVNGTVVVPKGKYLCTPLFLKSNFTLELQEGAVLLGHTDRSLYPYLPGYTVTTDERDEFYLGTWEGNPLDQNACLITGIDIENVSIIGRGTIDGNAQNGDWWINPKIKKDVWRPRTIYLKGCNTILIQGVTVKNSPSWTIHPYLSSKLSFIDLVIQNPKDSPNTDGLDPESCSDVAIVGVDFSVGDDCIAIKSGKLYMGKRLKRPSEQLTIRNCRMRHGHGAVVIGSEMSGGVRDVRVSQCIFEQTDRGLRIKTRRGRGEDGVIDNIHFENILMVNVLTPFVMNMFYFCDPDGKTEYVWSKEMLPVDDRTPRLGRFCFKDISCEGAEVAAAFFRGLPEQPIEEIVMENILIRFKEKAQLGHPAMMSHLEPMCKQGIDAEYVTQLHLKQVVIEGHVGKRLNIQHVSTLSEDVYQKEGESL